MKHVTVTNIDQFFNEVDKCEGSVELVTNNGDQLDLKATLSQFISRVKFLADASISVLK